MSRIDEALRRASRVGIAESENPAAATALERFPEGLDARQIKESGEASISPPPRSGSTVRSVSAVILKGAIQRLAEKLVVNKAIRQDSLEQYRRLGASLHQTQRERQIRSLIVTSAVPGEGKTLTATNVALTLSESYRRRVLLLDADLRRPTLHDVLQVPNASGLADMLKGGPERSPAQIQLSSRLTFIPAGNPESDPIGGLTSDRMRAFIERVSTQYDWVIIDTPPVGLLTDANLLTSMVDGILLVIKAGSTGFPSIERAVGALDRERVLGVILNQVSEETIGNVAVNYSQYYAGSDATSLDPSDPPSAALHSKA